MIIGETVKVLGDNTNENANKALWEKGDFTKIAALMRGSGAQLVSSLAVSPPIQVLDLGCGDGTTAVPLAMLGAEVLGVDIAANLVRAGNERAARAGLSRLTFQEGDACNLRGIADDSFDLVVTIFGAMFAPRPFDVAREMVRVARPGGRIVMGNWIPNDPTSFVSQLLRISSQYQPAPPAGSVSPMTWGMEANVIERFERAGVTAARISMVKDRFSFVAADKSPAEVVDLFRRYYGPTMNAYEAAKQIGEEERLHAELLELSREQNTRTGAGTSISATFLRVVVSL